MMSFLNPNIAYVLDPNLQPLPELNDVTNTNELKAERKKRVEDEVMCRGHILNTLSDRFYDFYNSIETPKKIWTALYWNDYKKKLLHRRDDISLKELQKHLRIEEETRSRDQKNIPHDSSKVNTIEGSHRISDCKFRKNNSWKKEDNTSNTANLVENLNEELVAMVYEMCIGMITELNMATAKSSNWWIDVGATIHVYDKKSMFSTYEEMKNDEVVLMRNHISAKVLGKGSVDLQFTYGKKLTLKNVFHVPEIRKNLVSPNLLCKNSFKVVLELNNCILTKNRSLDPGFISSQALTFLVEGDRNSVLNKIPTLLNIEEDPKTFSETILSRDASFWREAINDEMDSIMSNQTWIIVDLPPGSKPISCK
ncbi:hypothetical protein UlMin_022095 [Ulmus minor]